LDLCSIIKKLLLLYQITVVFRFFVQKRVFELLTDVKNPIPIRKFIQMTEKLALNDYPIHELIRSRWSPRAYSEQSVEQEKLLSLLEAARWAPSSYNHQPWSFIVATKDDPTEYNRLLSILVEFNQGWAKSTDTHFMMSDWP
jgi:hypothetical protein